MTVNDLIKQLEKHDGDHEVFISSDAEGNEIGPIDEVAINVVEDTDEQGAIVIWPY